MGEADWQRVDDYLIEHLLGDDDLGHVLTASEAAGLPPIAVSPLQGKLLHLLFRSHHCRRVLEIGTLGGYSTLWLAQALPPGGHLITLELDPKHAASTLR